MRPKKRILLIDENDDWVGRRRFLLTTIGYAVKPASNAAEALDTARTWNPELAVIGWSMAKGNLLRDLRNQNPFLPTMVLAEGIREYPADIVADCVLLGYPYASEILERVKVMAARKRGPRKKQVQSVSLAAAAERVA